MSGTAIIPSAISPAGESGWAPTPNDLENIRKLAALKYTASAICLALDIPGAEFRRHLAIEDDPVAKAYNAGRIEGTIEYRQRVMVAAARGEEWAVALAEKWTKEQLEDELGCHV